MHADLETRRRVLIVMYQRYSEADRRWNLALREMSAWFPTEQQPTRSRMGDPGSPIRRLYEQRKRAMVQLEAARKKLDVARQRLAEKRQTPTTTTFLCLTYTGPVAHIG
ncbi:hypothetical protein [Roseovarius arcticus]|uniref:hypothetical protein n=1 Tax=Roseovarius arcticus TaxID=2547404 RepID=UPI001110854F|nr:hypothetical protein [Roseovarius arcticus]